jgi:hypothetical protein
MRSVNKGVFWRVCRIPLIVFLVLLLCAIFTSPFWLNSPKADYTVTPLSLIDFYNRSGVSGVPATATNLYYAHAQAGFSGFVEIYRFDAPVADCIAYGERLLKLHADSKDATLVFLASPPDPIGRNYLDNMGLAKVDWIDVETIRSGFTGHRDATESGQPSMTFWIDGDQGRFYFYSSD